MRKGLIYLLIFVLLLVAPAGIRYWRFYSLDREERAAPPEYDPAEIAQVPTPEASSYVDDPELGEGFVLLDEAHRNSFTLEEIAYLDGRLAARGYELLPFTGGDLSTALRPVSAFVVITPLDRFTMHEIQVVADFVRRGGHLLLVGDPTRFNTLFDDEEFLEDFTLETDEIPLNSLANEFDITFTGDYLYNTVSNEGNFRNIILRPASASEDALLMGVNQLVFYSSHSLQVGPGGKSLLMADEDTWSSATDRAGELTLAATSQTGRVLALGDFHLFTEPYHTVYDNSRFIAQIADFLVDRSERVFVLADFPYFYDEEINLVYTGGPELGPNAFDEIIALQDAFRQVDLTVSLAATAAPEQDTLYLGLYNQSEDVAEILASYGISLTIDPPVLTEAELQAMADEAGEEAESEEAAENGEQTADGEEEQEVTRIIHSTLGDVQMSGTAMILLDQRGDQRQVIVLASSNDGLENTVGRLLDLIPIDADYVLSDCLLQANIALCPSNVAGEMVEAELDSGGIPETPGEEEEEVSTEEDGEAGEGGDEGEETAGDLDAVDQGPVGLGETVEGLLAEDEAHSWSFSDGPEIIDIVVSSDEIDVVLELYGPDDELIDASDSGFAGDDEQLLDVEIPDERTYHIVIRDFFGDNGSYSLSVSVAADESGEADGNIFVFADDDGQPLTAGFTSVETIANILGSDHQVTTWISSEDGALSGISLAQYDLVVWDSGDYRDTAGFVDEDTEAILAYTEDGGDLFITGISPTIFGGAELELLVDLKVAGDDPLLLDGLTVGEIIQLDQAYEAIVGGPYESDQEEGSAVFFVRGPESAESDMIVGGATAGEQKTVLLLAPLVALPGDVQELLLRNLMAWFGLSSS